MTWLNCLCTLSFFEEKKIMKIQTLPFYGMGWWKSHCLVFEPYSCFRGVLGAQMLAFLLRIAVRAMMWRFDTWELIMTSFSARSGCCSTLVCLYPEGTFSCFTCKTVISAVPSMRCHVLVHLNSWYLWHLNILVNLRCWRICGAASPFDLKIRLTPATEYILKIYRVLYLEVRNL